MADPRVQKVIQKYLRRMQGLCRKPGSGINSIELSMPGRPPVRITADGVEIKARQADGEDADG